MSVLRTLAALVLPAALLVACSASGATPALSSAPASQAPASQTPASQTPASQAPASQAAPSATAASVAIGTVKSANLGTLLTGPDGKTLYTHAGDSATSSTCTGDCATAWPPLTVPAGGQVIAGPGVTGTLGTLVRADGTTQVTYAGLPLYGWQGDANPGDVTGNGVNGFVVARVGGPAPAPSRSTAPRY
jgi:predicted lipoprotein with Yx(FWY)xxD motif